MAGGGLRGGGVTLSCVRWIFFLSSNPEKKLPSSVSSVSFAWRKIKEERKGGRGGFHQTGSWEETLPGNKSSPEYLSQLVKTKPVFQSGRHHRDDTFAVSHTAK